MSRMRAAVCLGLVLMMSAGLASPVLARKGRSDRPLKLSIRRPKKKAGSGEKVAVRVKLRNRTDEARTARLVLTFEGSADPAHDSTLTLLPRERRRMAVEVILPQEYRGRRLRLSARLEDEIDEARVKVRSPENGSSTPTEVAAGRLLFAANCAGCHEASDRELRKEDLDDWLEVVREGDDGMPAFPALTPGEVRGMRDYFLAPDLDGAGPGPSPDDVERLLGKNLYSANCAACHGDRGGEIRHEDFGDWREAVFEGEDDMPTFPSMSLDDVRAMRKYIQDPDRDVTPPDAPPPPPPAEETVTYEGSVRAILTRSCVACHRSGNALGAIQLDTYATAFANRTVLVDAVVKDRMPPASPLAIGDKGVLEAWFKAGSPEK